MSDEPVTIQNYLDAEDTHSTLEALRVLGAGVDEQGGELVVRGVGLRGALEATGGHARRRQLRDADAAAARLARRSAGRRLDARRRRVDPRRPVDRIAEPLRAMGADVEARDGRFPPLTVRGGELRASTTSCRWRARRSSRAC